MKNLLFIALVVGAAFLGGCNKGGPMSEFRVKKITSGRGQATEFTYTSDNKISLIKNSDSTKMVYTYAGNSITQAMSNPLNGQSMSQVMHVNGAGYVDSSSVTTPRGSFLTVTTHDADGYTTLTQEYSTGALKRSTQSVFNKDGNETARTISDETLKPLGTIFFDYYLDKPNSLAPENQGMKFIGKDSKNLMKKVVQVLAKGDTIGTTIFSYQYDDKGRVISKVSHDEKGMLQDSASISYY